MSWKHACPPRFHRYSRFWFLVIFMSVNTMLGIALLLIFETDFPSVLLFIFLTNVGMYLTFYLVMKKLAGERLTWPTLIFLVLTAVFMLPALYFFRSEVKNTGVGPALSKEINQPCFEGLNYFDNHDVWHFLSRWKEKCQQNFRFDFSSHSFGLFFALAFLLTLDDDIAEYDQANIQVWWLLNSLLSHPKAFFFFNIDDYHKSFQWFWNIDHATEMFHHSSR